ncbi:MAG TPA: hypothetical protein VG406_22035, partial [Isosphaeraceae bacterium]|nr:hypothetical protein [Isosphaeraceae bacterium]
VRSPWVMTMVLEVAAPELELDPYSLPSSTLMIDAPLGLAVRIACLDSLDAEAEFVTHHSEKKNDPLLVNWSMSEPAQGERTCFANPCPARICNLVHGIQLVASSLQTRICELDAFALGARESRSGDRTAVLLLSAN